MPNAIQVQILAETAKARSEIQGVRTQLGGLERSAKSAAPTLKGVLGANLITGGIGAAVGGLRALGGALSDSVGEARESQVVGATTAQIIKATGGAANISASQIGDLSTALSTKTGIDDEAIQSGSNLLLTFKNVKNEVGAGNDVFNRATAAAVDLSKAGFGSIEGGSKMLGKALNDPVKGISALSRAGVTFTADQKKQIGTLVKSGDTLKAQKMILKEVESQVGGVAAANATAGEKATTYANNLKEQFGNALLPGLDKAANFFTSTLGPALSRGIAAIGPAVAGIKAAVAPLVAEVRPIVTTLVAAFRDNLPTAIAAGKAAFSGLTAVLTNPIFQSVAGAVLAVVAAMRIYAAYQAVLAAVTKAYAAVQLALNVIMAANPIGIVVLAVVALVAAFVIAYKKSETFRNVVNGALNAVKAVAIAVWNAIKVAAGVVWKAISTYVRVNIAIVRAILNGIKSAAVAVWNAIKSAASATWGAIRAVVSAVINGIKAYLNGVRATASAVWGAIRSAASTAFNAVKTSVSTAIAGAKAILDGLKSKASEILSSIKGTFSPSALYSAGSNMIQGLINGISGAIGAVISKAREVASAAVTAAKNALGIHSPSTVFKSLGRFVGQGFADGIVGTSTQVKAAVRKLSNAAKDAVGKGGISSSQSVKVRRLLNTYDDKLIKKAKAKVTLEGKLAKAEKRGADLRKARSDYAASVKSAALSYAAITSIDAPEGQNLTASTLITGLRDRLNALQNFQRRLAALKKLGLNSTTYNQLVQAGVDGGAAEASALLKGGKSAVSSVNTVQGQINKAAGSLGTTTSGAMYDAGVKAAAGLIKGLKADSKELDKAAQAIADTLTSKIKKALKIHSPSRVFEGIGTNVTRGLVLGLDSAAVSKGAQALAGSLVGGFGVPSLSTPEGGLASGRGGNTYNVTIQASPGSSPADIGRELVGFIREYERVTGK